MRLIFCSNFTQPCGIADYSHNLIAELEKLVQVEIVELPAGLKADGSLFSYFRCAYGFYRLGRLLNCGDICHIQHEYSFWGSFFLRTNMFPFFSHGIRVPVVMTAHELINPEYHAFNDSTGIMRIFRWLLNPQFTRYSQYVNSALFAWPDQTIVHTEEQRQLLITRGVPTQKITVLPHGVPAIESLGYDKNFLSKLGLQKRRYFTLIGFLTERKGYDLVLDVLGDLPDDIVFVIAGGPRVEEDREYAEKLRSRITRENLSSRVCMTGYLEPAQLAAVLVHATAVIAPFQKVSGSGSLSLALAANRAIIASDLVSLKALQKETDALLLFRSGNATELRNCLYSVFHDEQLRKNLEAAAHRYSQNNSFAIIAEKTCRLYDMILTKNATKKLS